MSGLRIWRQTLIGAVSMALLGLVCLPVLAAPAAPASGKGPASLLPGTGSHEPINIDAGRLDYFDKEQKLIYSGSVVAVQGDSTLKASQLTIFLTKDDAKTGAAPAGETAAATAAAAPPGAGSSVRRMEAKGPVTLISKDQIGTGDNGTYDKGENKVTLTGNVTLSQGPNVTRGDRLVYDLTSGQAQVFSGQTRGRVGSVFTPGSGEPGESASSTPAKPGAATPAKKKPAPKAKPTGGTASTQ